MEVYVARTPANVADNHLKVAQPPPNVAHPKKVAPKEVDVARTPTNVADK